MKITKVVLQCKCGYQTMGGRDFMTIESKKWLKKKMRDGMVICPNCESLGPFKTVAEGGS